MIGLTLCSTLEMCNSLQVGVHWMALDVHPFMSSGLTPDITGHWWMDIQWIRILVRPVSS
ncbi:hypothetical protein FA13DRAFT_1735773, partial [Coprinellus micaceus]